MSPSDKKVSDHCTAAEDEGVFHTSLCMLNLPLTPPRRTVLLATLVTPSLNTNTPSRYLFPHPLLLLRKLYSAISQVILDNENIHRRKSSIVSEDARRLAQQRSERRFNTACRVHDLLKHDLRDAHRKKAPPAPPTAGVKYELKKIAEDIKGPETGEKAQKGGAGEEGDGNGIRSRMLTKKQLSEMAWGVRELSKKLGGIRLKLKVKTVFLLTKAHDEDLIGNTRRMTEWLLAKERDTPYIVYVEDTMEHNKAFDAKGLLKDHPNYEGRLKYWTNELCAKRPQTFDFVVTLGGDGTVLYASWLFQRIVPPVLAFALGSLGFLTKFDYDKFEDTLTKSFKDGVTVSLRLRFECTVMRSEHRKSDPPKDLVEELIGEEEENEHTHRPDGQYEILNDVVVDRGPNPSM
jgi:NAD+ kinase